jgi:acetyl-CoA carboxylase carboxyltransferase component
MLLIIVTCSNGEVRTRVELLFSSAQLWDDGMIDPLETRAKLALGIAASLNAGIPPATSFGVFRM